MSNPMIVSPTLSAKDFDDLEAVAAMVSEVAPAEAFVWCCNFQEWSLLPAADAAEAIRASSEGQAFWAEGELRWRLLDSGRVRLRYLGEGPSPAGLTPVPADETKVWTPEDLSYLLWGEPDPAGGYTTGRIPVRLHYPGLTGRQPRLLVRRYTVSGVTVAERLCGLADGDHTEEN